MKKLFVVLCAGLLAGCAGAVPWNPQNNAGLTNVDIEWCPVADGADYKICSIQFVDGKERQNTSLKADLATGTVEYAAEAETAFPAFKGRADVEKFVAEKFSDVTGDVAAAIVEVLVKEAGL